VQLTRPPRSHCTPGKGEEVGKWIYALTREPLREGKNRFPFDVVRKRGKAKLFLNGYVKTVGSTVGRNVLEWESKPGVAVGRTTSSRNIEFAGHSEGKNRRMPKERKPYKRDKELKERKSYVVPIPG